MYFFQFIFSIQSKVFYKQATHDDWTDAFVRLLLSGLRSVKSTYFVQTKLLGDFANHKRARVYRNPIALAQEWEKGERRAHAQGCPCWFIQ